MIKIIVLSPINHIAQYFYRLWWNTEWCLTICAFNTLAYFLVFIDARATFNMIYKKKKKIIQQNKVLNCGRLFSTIIEVYTILFVFKQYLVNNICHLLYDIFSRKIQHIVRDNILFEWITWK